MEEIIDEVKVANEVAGEKTFEEDIAVEEGVMGSTDSTTTDSSVVE